MRKTYPETIQARDLADLIGGQCLHGLLPQEQLELEKVSINGIIAMWCPDNDPNPEYYQAMSADDWAEEFEPGYYGLERALRRGDDVPPLVLKRLKNGRLRWLDGAHRITIALSLGITELDAYVYTVE
jgi:hypothetical protein